MKETDIKLLWGRAGGKCSISDCKRGLCEDKRTSSASFPVGEQAHIVAEDDDGPRGKSILTKSERNSYPNLILLCPTHHTIIDKNVDDFPVEKLHIIKREHELYIERTTSLEPSDNREMAATLIYTSLIDAAVEGLALGAWNLWTSWLMAAIPRLLKERYDAIREFRKRIIGAVWPGTNTELERTLLTLSELSFAAIERFMCHVDMREDYYYGEKFYKRKDYDPFVYSRELAAYNQWLTDVDELVIEASKAANWFADVVRRDLNPLFFAVEGRFLLTHQQGLSFGTTLFEFSNEQKGKLPELIRGKVKELLSRED